jgi:hypothetical protein
VHPEVNSLSLSNRRLRGALRERSIGLIVLLGALVAGCGGDGTGSQGGGTGGTTGPSATFSAVYPMMFPETTNARCNFCHSMVPTESGNGKLHMGSDQATAYGALVGKTSVSARCMGKTLVVAGHPEMSLLFQKLSPNPPCGSRMPLGGTAFTDAQLEMIRSWIAAGANP